MNAENYNADGWAIIEEFVQCTELGRPPGKLIAQAKDYLAASQQGAQEPMRSDLSGYAVAASQVRRGYDVECDRCGKFCDEGPGPCQPVGPEPSIDYEDLLDRAKDLIQCGCSVSGAFDWLLEQLTDGESLAAPPAQAVDLGKFRPIVQKERTRLANSVDRMRVQLSEGLRPEVRTKVQSLFNEELLLLGHADDFLVLIDSHAAMGAKA